MCMACHHANPAEAKYCANCGAGLLRRFCPACHVINDADALYCHACGGKLEPQVGLEPTVVLSRPAVLDEPTVRQPAPSPLAVTAPTPELAMVEAILPGSEITQVMPIERVPTDVALTADADAAYAPPRRTVALPLALAAAGCAVILGGWWLVRQSNVTGPATATSVQPAAPVESKTQSTVSGTVQPPAAANLPNPGSNTSAAAPMAAKPPAPAAAPLTATAGAAAAPAANAAAAAPSTTSARVEPQLRVDMKAPARTEAKPKAEPAQPQRRAAGASEKPTRKPGTPSDVAARSDTPAPAATRVVPPPRPPSPAATECTPTIEALGLCTLAPRQQGR